MRSIETKCKLAKKCQPFVASGGNYKIPIHSDGF